MKSLFFLGSILPLLKASSLSCYEQDFAAEYSFSSTSSSSVLVSLPETTTSCDSGACGIAKYDVDLTITTNSSLLWIKIIEFLLGGSNKIKSSYSISSEGCVDSNVCSILTGGVDNCRKTVVEFDTWIPNSCNASTNYDAIIFEYNSTFSYGCCSSDSCNSGSGYDYSQCTTEESFANYFSDLYECWNNEKKDFMKYLYCSSGRYAYDLVSSCYYQGSYDWSNATCKYSLTCDPTLQSVLTNFGECACSAAKNNGYSGVLVADFLETQWNSYCPNIALSCASNDTLAAYITFYYVTYTFNLNVAVSDVDADFQASIIAAVADAAYLNVSVVSVTSVKQGDVTDTTEIVVSISTQSSNDQSNVQSNCQTHCNNQVQSKTAASVLSSSISTSSSSQSLTSSGGGSSSSGGNNLSANSFFHKKIVLFALVMVFISVLLF